MVQGADRDPVLLVLSTLPGWATGRMWAASRSRSCHAAERAPVAVGRQHTGAEFPGMRGPPNADHGAPVGWIGLVIDLLVGDAAWVCDDAAEQGDLLVGDPDPVEIFHLGNVGAHELGPEGDDDLAVAASVKIAMPSAAALRSASSPTWIEGDLPRDPEWWV